MYYLHGVPAQHRASLNGAPPIKGCLHTRPLLLSVNSNTGPTHRMGRHNRVVLRPLKYFMLSHQRSSSCFWLVVRILRVDLDSNLSTALSCSLMERLRYVKSASGRLVV